MSGELGDVPAELEGQVKPELMESVLEVATKPCPDLRTAGEQLATLRTTVEGAADGNFGGGLGYTRFLSSKWAVGALAELNPS